MFSSGGFGAFGQPAGYGFDFHGAAAGGVNGYSQWGQVPGGASGQFRGPELAAAYQQTTVEERRVPQAEQAMQGLSLQHSTQQVLAISQEFRLQSPPLTHLPFVFLRQENQRQHLERKELNLLEKEMGLSRALTPMDEEPMRAMGDLPPPVKVPLQVGVQGRRCLGPQLPASLPNPRHHLVKQKSLACCKHLWLVVAVVPGVPVGLTGPPTWTLAPGMDRLSKTVVHHH